MDYLVVDLETGEKRHTDAAPDLSRGICRTKELRLRRIPRGTFAMGTLVEIREKNGEGSAWLARVGAPLRRGEGGPGRRGNPLHQIFSGKFRRPGLQSPLVGLE